MNTKLRQLIQKAKIEVERLECQQSVSVEDHTYFLNPRFDSLSLTPERESTIKKPFAFEHQNLQLSQKAFVAPYQNGRLLKINCD